MASTYWISPLQHCGLPASLQGVQGTPAGKVEPGWPATRRPQTRLSMTQHGWFDQTSQMTYKLKKTFFFGVTCTHHFVSFQWKTKSSDIEHLLWIRPWACTWGTHTWLERECLCAQDEYKVEKVPCGSRASGSSGAEGGGGGLHEDFLGWHLDLTWKSRRASGLWKVAATWTSWWEDPSRRFHIKTNNSLFPEGTCLDREWW